MGMWPSTERCGGGDVFFSFSRFLDVVQSFFCSPKERESFG